MKDVNLFLNIRKSNLSITLDIEDKEGVRLYHQLKLESIIRGDRLRHPRT